MTKEVLPEHCSGVRRGEGLTSFDAVCRGEPRYNAFTLIELIVVIGIIIILSGLVLSTVGYARKKGARARAETEIAAMSAACENYKADNAVYPSNNDTNGLDPTANFDSSPPPPGQTNAYSLAGLSLYEKLLGVTSGNRSETPTTRTYFTFKPNMLHPPPPSTDDVVGIRDPFGNLYGYSTKKASDPTTNGYNPTFDLWSTAGGTASSDTPKWIKNW
ncbi:MAG: prepilin-type N-terminal cleavage/methylation domain-containing protein [Nitrospirota bacterium]